MSLITHRGNMVDTSKTGSYWTEEYATPQLHRSSHAEINKFLLADVILFKRLYFWQYFACLCESIFNCCNVLRSSWSYSSWSNSSGYLRGYRLQWTPFCLAFPTVT